MNGRPQSCTLFPYTTLFRSALIDELCSLSLRDPLTGLANRRHFRTIAEREIDRVARSGEAADRKSTRLNSSHGYISYAVFCLKKKNQKNCVNAVHEDDVASY